MLLSEWMRREGLSDADVAAAVDLSEFTVRKLRFRDRGTSLRVAARIEALSGGQVRAHDLQPRQDKHHAAPEPEAVP